MATSKEKDASAQVPPTRATGLGSATGTALHEAERDDVPQGADRGSKVEIEGGEPEPDALNGAAPRGRQAEPAKFTSNGSIPVNTIPSASGPVPVSASTASPEEANKRLEETERAQDEAIQGTSDGRKRLSEATVGRVGKAELRAIASTRGYDLGEEGGTRRTRNAFLKAQDEDQDITSEEEGAVYEGRRATRATKGAKKSSRKSGARKSSARKR